MTGNPTACDSGLPARSVDIAPKAASMKAQDTHSCARYVFVATIVADVTSAAGPVVIASPKKSTPDRVGEASRQAW